MLAADELPPAPPAPVLDARVLLDGRAPTFKIVDDLKGKLETADYFRATRLTGAKMDSQYEMIRFNFHLEKKGGTQQT